MNDRQNIKDPAAQLRTLLGLFITEVMSYDTDRILRLLKREDLSMPRIGALKVVERQGAASISQISACLDLSLGNTSILIDKLVCHGFVTRVEDTSDRRHKQVRLTEKGRALVQELRDTQVDNVVQRMLLLPPDLIDRAITVLGEVTAQLPHITPNPLPRAHESANQI
jgi:DNA-binding MarR family transcriptional regulator